MKRPLELMDIIRYTPYGCAVKCKVSNDHGIYWITDVNITGATVRLNGVRQDRPYGLDQIKPYLRPLSDLTKEICADNYKDGLPFIPVKELKAEVPGLDNTAEPFELWRADANQWAKVFELLDYWMFDYKGLIRERLAIDVNTLKKNPYAQ